MHKDCKINITFPMGIITHQMTFSQNDVTLLSWSMIVCAEIALMCYIYIYIITEILDCINGIYESNLNEEENLFLLNDLCTL